MLYDIIQVKVVKDYILFIRFENGEEGLVDISNLVPFEGVFEKLEDKKYFQTVKLSKELGTIIWDNGADLSPSYLYFIINKNAA